MLERVTLDQLRMLIQVVECGSFSAAARQLHRVQSAVSQSIQALEDSLEITLFDRSNRLPVLTKAGVAIHKEAEKIIRNMDALRARAKSISSTAEVELTLAIEQVFPNSVLMESLKQLQIEFPHVSVTLSAEGLGGPVESLLENDTQLSIYSPVIDGAPGIQMDYLGSIPLVVTAAADHPLAKIKGRIHQDDLDDHIQLALTDRTKRYRGLLMAARYWSFVDQNHRLDYVRNGFGWCCMPRHIAQQHLDSGELVELDLKIYGGRSLVFPLYTAYRVNSPPGPALSWLLDDLSQRFQEWMRTVAPPASNQQIQIRVTSAL